MTNEEAIEVLNGNIMYANELARWQRNEKEIEMMEVAINALQENAKLKAEIKNSNRIISNMMDEHECGIVGRNIEIVNLKAEIEELHNGLKWTSEKRDICLKEINRLKYVAKVNVRIMNLNYKQYKEVKQLKLELKQSVKLPYPIDTPIYLPFTNKGVVEDRIRRWTISKKGLLFYTRGTSYCSDAIGKAVFLTQEEAEQALKGKVES